MTTASSSPTDRGAGAMPCAGLRVIELAADPGGEFTSQLLAELGAQVIKVEPPEGSASRNVGPFANDIVDPNRSLHFWYYNTNKQSVIADLHSDAGRQLFEQLLRDADILVTTLQPRELKALRLDYASLQIRFPRLIVCSVTPFGLDGPWADYLSSDLVALAAGGPLNSCGYDDHSLPPIRPGGNQAYHTAASYAQIGVMLALLERQQTNRGQLVDVSTHEALAVTVELANPYWFYPRVHVHRQTCRHAQPVPTQPALFLCGDGRYVYFVLIVAEQKPWQALLGWLDRNGFAADLTDPMYSDVAYRQKNFDHVQGLVESFFMITPAEEVYRQGQALGLPIGILNAPEDLLADEHLRARDFFVPVHHEGLGPVLYPGATTRFSSFDAPPIRRAPLLGEHGADIASALAKENR